MKRVSLLLDEQILGEIRRRALANRQSPSRIANDLLMKAVESPTFRVEELPAFDMGEAFINVANRKQLSKVTVED